MIEVTTVPGAAKSLLVSIPSYYRLAKLRLVPPPVRLTPNRSVVVVNEVESVKAARVAGASDSTVQDLVRSLMDARKTKNRVTVEGEK